jgi:ABC-type dipeptide/oligopeptide/nickel transport system permease subunit
MLSPEGTVALMTFVIIVLAVLGGPLVWQARPDETHLENTFAGMSQAHPLGTDQFGRDILSRLLIGGRLSLAGAALVLGGTSMLGIVIGALAGLGGRRIDALVSRMVDGLLALPTLVVALSIVGVLGGSLPHLLLALVITGWPWYARVYRGLFLVETNKDYVVAARALGASPIRIAHGHIWPNLTGPALVLSAFNLGGAILGLTALSFLGLGTPPPQAEWGAMINDARVYFQTEPWVITAPGLAIGVTVLTVNLLGDALHEAMDPQRRKSRQIDRDRPI